ncbi:hypothetical protein B857_03099 [Solibacillus isronensis B3W22]|uniref:Uncharacterized protein n=1 Tax=Solibacillus isronensis B3W22 TaxID=1224748 RepID=K1KZT1_9BACL|nr:hypothetical protein B857_03099 [Solibacillus isronensis B3W22]
MGIKLATENFDLSFYVLFVDEYPPKYALV